MRLDENCGVDSGKIAELQRRIARLGIDLDDVQESFTRGGGPGGTKRNKTSSVVVLRYAPLELVVRCSRERKQSLNRFLALRELVDRIEMEISPGTSKRLTERAGQRRRKANRDRRARRRDRKEQQGETDSGT